jgi:hypothetical protein
VSTYWAAYSRNKESVELDLRSEEGKKDLHGLIEKADMLVENFRPGTLERMGLTRDFLQTLNPRLIAVRISGWGQTGLFANKGGFGSLIEAMSGFAAMNGFADRPPVLPPFAMADNVAGLYGAVVALALLHAALTNPECVRLISHCLNHSFLCWGHKRPNSNSQEKWCRVRAVVHLHTHRETSTKHAMSVGWHCQLAWKAHWHGSLMALVTQKHFQIRASPRMRLGYKTSMRWMP